MTTTHNRRIAPGEVDAAQAARALLRITGYLARRGTGGEPIEVLGETGDDKLVLPRQVVDMLVAILQATASGKGVQIMPVNAELTTQQAADLLNVSRPFLIKLLDENHIDHRRVGRHRRIRFDALMADKARNDADRRKIADELTQLGQEIGED
jgi:excisionase family DNA binding protein